MVRLGRARRYGESVVVMARRHGKVRARAEARCREREYASTCTGSQPTRLRFVALPIALVPRVWSGRDVGVTRLKSTIFLYINPFRNFDSFRNPVLAFAPYRVDATGGAARLAFHHRAQNLSL